MRSVVIALVLSAMVLCATADKPPDTSCVTWVAWDSNTPITDITQFYTAAYTWCVSPIGDCTTCEEEGYILPCFCSDTNTWGHHDFVPDDFPTDQCRTWIQGATHYCDNFYLPQKGAQVQTWKWQLTQTGATVPANAIRYQGSVMARSTSNRGGCCMGQGFTGWAEGQTNGTFGDVHFTIADEGVTYNSFDVAICTSYTPTPSPTPTPTTPAPTPAPTLPPPTKPYIRFAHALPSLNNLDAEIYQASSGVVFSWNNYKFGEFSDWNELFEDGTGSITLWQNSGGSRVQPALLANVTIPLTPGPLVVAVKANLGLVNRGWWPPNQATNIETIAASYVPSNNSNSGVRLFNLSPDTTLADLYTNGNELVQGVKYTLGSVWAPVPVTQATFTVKDDKSGLSLGATTTTPPNPPFVFTVFLIGSQNATGALGTQVVPLIDAPEA